MRRVAWWGVLIVVFGLLAQPVSVLAGGVTPFGAAGGQAHGFGRHHGAGGGVVILAPPPVFVPALGGGPVQLFHDTVIVAPSPVIVAPAGPFWIPGHWQWTGTSWVWAPGHWR